MAGEARLSIRLAPAQAHDEAGRPSAGPRRLPLGLPVAIEAVRTCDFEAIVEYVVGLGSLEPYRTLELVDPVRLAVDVRHPDR